MSNRRKTKSLPVAPKPWINTAEAMELAGCARRTLGEWMERKVFKWFRPINSGSSRVRINRESFERFLNGEVSE